jgi:hypothetical protein
MQVHIKIKPDDTGHIRHELACEIQDRLLDEVGISLGEPFSIIRATIDYSPAPFLWPIDPAYPFSTFRFRFGATDSEIAKVKRFRHPHVTLEVAA